MPVIDPKQVDPPSVNKLDGDDMTTDVPLTEDAAPVRVGGRIVEGTLPANDPRRAFVEGAKWWEYKTTGATMWQSDRNLAEAEAQERWERGDWPKSPQEERNKIMDLLKKHASGLMSERNIKRLVFWIEQELDND